MFDLVCFAKLHKFVFFGIAFVLCAVVSIPNFQGVKTFLKNLLEECGRRILASVGRIAAYSSLEKSSIATKRFPAYQ